MVSVIVPIYQVKEYLAKCIDSICAQDYGELEIILVDDGSTDGSGQICDEYAQNDDRIKVIHKENGGLSSSRNAGLDIAKGEYVAFVDSDDWLDHRFISAMLKVCEENKCQICQCGFTNVVDEKATNEDDIYSPVIYSGREFQLSEFLLLSWECVISCNKLYKIELFRDVRFPVGKINEDEATTYKIVDKADKIGFLTARLYYYRYREGSTSKNQNIYRQVDKNAAFDDRAKYYEEKGENNLRNLTNARHYQWLNYELKEYRNIIEQDKQYEERLLQIRDELSAECDKEKIKRRDFFRRQTIFPFDRVEKGSRILLYGAGKAGQQFFLQIKATNYCDIKAWVDKDYKRLREQGVPVQDITTISLVCNECDYFVLAIKDIAIAVEVKKMLQDVYHVDGSKIIYTFNTTIGIL